MNSKILKKTTKKMKQVFLKALSTKDINICLNKFNHFIGAFAADEVFLKNSKLPQSFVINTDNKSESGEHWTALIIEQNNKVLFFDPLGCQLLNNYVLTQIKKIGIKKYIYNSQQIQPINSNGCGFYCIAFIIAFHYNISYSKFLKMFSMTTSKNDNICFEFIDKFI